MTWILLEGLDRSGKSSVAKHYEKQGYKVVHMNAPDKKYFALEYSGESYLEEMVRLYSKYDGQNVVFDRTIYGELVWPNVYGRVALLNDEDLEYLSMMERNNECSKILMFDPNTESHWQRCVDNKEPLNRQQFGRANIFYERLCNDFGFIKKELTDFPEIMPTRPAQDVDKGLDTLSETNGSLSEPNGDVDSSGINNGATQMGEEQRIRSNQGNNSDVGSVENKLERANAIRVLLSGALVKKKGEVYEHLDEAIRGFLQRELDSIFTAKLPVETLTSDEITILKAMAQRIKEKM